MSTLPSPGSGSNSGSSIGTNSGTYSGSSRTPGRLLDAAVAAVDIAVEAVRYDRLDPAELSTVMAGFRELFWHATTLAGTLNDAYSRLDGLAHDHGHDPAASVTAVIEAVAMVTGGLAVIDQALADAHDHAAHLYRP